MQGPAACLDADHAKIGIDNALKELICKGEIYKYCLVSVRYIDVWSTHEGYITQALGVMGDF